jgi:hypothetical protein
MVHTAHAGRWLILLVTGNWRRWFNPSIAHQHYRRSGPVFTGPLLFPRNKHAIAVGEGHSTEKDAQ